MHTLFLSKLALKFIGLGLNGCNLGIELGFYCLKFLNAFLAFLEFSTNGLLLHGGDFLLQVLTFFRQIRDFALEAINLGLTRVHLGLGNFDLVLLGFYLVLELGNVRLGSVVFDSPIRDRLLTLGQFPVGFLECFFGGSHLGLGCR